MVSFRLLTVLALLAVPQASAQASTAHHLICKVCGEIVGALQQGGESPALVRAQTDALFAVSDFGGCLCGLDALSSS